MPLHSENDCPLCSFPFSVSFVAVMFDVFVHRCWLHVGSILVSLCMFFRDWFPLICWMVFCSSLAKHSSQIRMFDAPVFLICSTLLRMGVPWLILTPRWFRCCSCCNFGLGMKIRFFRNPNAQKTLAETPSSNFVYLPRPRAELCRSQLR